MGSLSTLASMPLLKVVFLRNNSFSGAVPKLPNHLGALYLDHNKGLSSLDADSVSNSAPSGGFVPGGCSTDWPSSKALNACCMAGDSWPSSVYNSQCLEPCFPAGPPVPTPAPTPQRTSYDCNILSYQCIERTGPINGTFPTKAVCECVVNHTADLKKAGCTVLELTVLEGICTIVPPPPTPKPTPKHTPPPTPKPTPRPTPAPTPLPPLQKCYAAIEKACPAPITCQCIKTHMLQIKAACPAQTVTQINNLCASPQCLDNFTKVCSNTGGDACAQCVVNHTADLKKAGCTVLELAVLEGICTIVPP
jgi:hypothetical protein